MNDLQSFLYNNIGKILTQDCIDYSILSIEDQYEFYRLCKAHDVHILVYGSFIESNVSNFNKELLSKWKQRYLKSNLDTMKKLKYAKKIFACFVENNIEAVVLKGIGYARYYSKYSERRMGDIDILVKGADIVKSCEILEEIGYEKVSYEGIETHHYVFKLDNNYCIELHKELVIKKKFPNIYGFKENILANSCRTNFVGLEFRTPSVENEMLYCIFHMYKHYYSEGFGLKQVCDLYYIIDRNIIDWDFVTSKLREHKVYNFSKCLLKLLHDDFRLDIPENIRTRLDVDDNYMDLFKEDIMLSGVFGRFDMSRYISNHIADYSVENSMKGRIGKMAFLFPKRGHLSNFQRYKYVRMNPLLLPVAWIHRILSNIIRRDIGSKDNRVSDELISNRIILRKWVLEK